MALDWGLYSAMRGTDNWAQRRQDKQMNLQIIEKQSAIEDQKMKRSLAAEEELNEYFNELDEMEFLTEDQGRVNQVEKDARANVIKGISSVNGDLTRYMSSGGLTDLNTYRNSVMKSEEVKQAFTNKANLKQFLDAKTKGQYIHKVNVPQEELDAEGNPTGKMILRPMSFEENYRNFKEGKVKSLEWTGAEKKGTVDPLVFSKQPKDPRNPYSEDNLVTTSNIVNYLMKDQGVSRAQAEDTAREYKRVVEAGGDPWRWGNKSNLEKMLIEEKIKSSRASRADSGPSGTQILNQELPHLQSTADGDRNVISPKSYEFWKKHFRLNFDSKTNTQRSTGDLYAFDADPNSRMEYDLSKALNVEIAKDYVTFKDKNGKLQYGIEAEVIYPADMSDEEGTPIDEGLFYSNALKQGSGGGWQYANASEFGVLPEAPGTDVYKGKVYIPITREVASGSFKDDLNKYRNITNKVQGYAPSADHMDERVRVNSIIEGYMNEHNVDYNTAREHWMNR